jgi:hypothetical protein
MATPWILKKAALVYDYKVDPVKAQNSTSDFIRLFVKHDYTIQVSGEGKVTSPSVLDIRNGTKVVLTGGTTVGRNYPVLTPSASGTEGINWISYPDGGVWRIASIRWTFNTVTGIWTTHVILKGEWDKYLRVPLTNNVYKDIT